MDRHCQCRKKLVAVSLSHRVPGKPGCSTSFMSQKIRIWGSITCTFFDKSSWENLLGRQARSVCALSPEKQAFIGYVLHKVTSCILYIAL